MTNQNDGPESFEDRLKSIELRLANLETALVSYSHGRITERPDELNGIRASLTTDSINDEETGLESRFGRVGLAWLGNIVLLFAVIFFTEYLITLGFRLLSIILGVFAVGGISFISNYLKTSNANLSFMLRINSQAILFYEVLRVHFFSSDPLISGMYTGLAILLPVIIYQIYSSVKYRSQTSGFFAVLFVLIAGTCSNTMHIMLPFLTGAAILAAIYFLKFNWHSLLIVTIILVYIAFFIWLFGNPVMGNTMEILSEHKNGHLYLFAIGACFSFVPLIRKNDGSNDEFLATTIILNGIFFTLLLSLITTKYFSENYVGLFSAITACCLLYSIVLKSVSDWKFAAAFYALYGFLTMSISLYGLVGLPVVYLLLSVQSLIVVSMALWFRNGLMIVMNSLLFLTILLVYQVSSNSVNAVNFSFALVPLVSARIINWQKARLDIKTDFIRNLYLTEGFLMILYALYNGLPKHFITLSWTVTALIYFLLSIVLRNIKYRYMALVTMICATIYLFIVDLARIEFIYRVLAFLFLAVVSIGISIYYNNRFKESTKNHEPE